MKDLLEPFINDAPKEEIALKKRRTKYDGVTRKQFTLGALVVLALLLCLCVYWTIDTVAVGTEAALDSFGAAKDNAAKEAYQIFYDASYVAAEKTHHVSNNVSITIGDLREEQKLEVLKISDVAYKTSGSENQIGFEGLVTSITGIFNADAVSWLEVPGSGIFTVNLQAGEFIIDEERQYVLIRVPNPELTEFAIDYENVKPLYFEEGGASKNSAKDGVDIAMEQLQSAELIMMQDANNNQEFYNRAKESTEKMLVTLVQQLNPQLYDLVVKVEFID